MGIFDLHCDTLSLIRNNEKTVEETVKQLRRGNVSVQCFAAFVTPDKKHPENEKKDFYAQAEAFSRLLIKTKISAVKSSAEIEENIKNNKISAILTAENIGFTHGKREEIDALFNMGVRIASLTWNDENKLGFPCSDESNIHLMGLKPLGIDAVEYMDKIGMTVDVSHLSMGGFYDVSRICKGPIIASHSACNKIYSHKRNLYDSQLRIIGNKGGVVGINFYSRFLNGGNETTNNDIVNTAKHIANVAGIDTVSIGSDFDGMTQKGAFQSAESFSLIPEILNSHFSADDTEKICFGNAYRITTYWG